MRVPKGVNSFLLLWTLAVVATTAAFSVFLAIRVQAVELGYQMGEMHSHIGRLREVRRILELELASQKTPERVELVARSLLRMSEPAAERIFHAGPEPTVEEAEGGDPAVDVATRETP
jgi:cell division protein FtsL